MLLTPRNKGLAKSHLSQKNEFVECETQTHLKCQNCEFFLSVFRFTHFYLKTDFCGGGITEFVSASPIQRYHQIYSAPPVAGEIAKNYDNFSKIYGKVSELVFLLPFRGV